MEATREIYWNIGHGAGVLVPMYLLTLMALAALAWGFWKRIRTYRQGHSLMRSDAMEQRVVNLVRDVLSQKKVMRGSRAGVAHGIFFWGFFLLFLGTCLILLQADITHPLMGLRFLKGTFYKAFSLSYNFV